MYSFQGLGEYELSVDKILALKPDAVLWRYYIGRDFELGRKIPAPYRTDKIPSFTLIINSRTGRLSGKDYGSGGFHGDIFDYIQMKYDLDFYSALVKVNLDFNLGLSYNPAYTSSVSGKITMREAEVLATFQKSYEQKDVFIDCATRFYNEDDIAYWTQYGITGVTLHYYHVKAAEWVRKDGTISYTHKRSDPCYVYLFPKAEYRPKACVKCYWPKRKDNRFMGNCSHAHDVQGYDQCNIARKEHSKLVVLTKSLKDCMVLREFGIEAMATHGESQKFSADFIRHLRKYYDTIISLYDRDATGINGSKYLWKDYRIRPYFINKKYKCKDISDLYKVHGKQIVNNFINQITRNADKENYGDFHPEERPESVQQ